MVHYSCSTLVLKTTALAVFAFICFKTLLSTTGDNVNISRHQRQQSLLSNETSLSPKDPPRKSRIGKILMQYGPENPLYERGIATHDAHNDRFGYPMFILREKTLPGYWSKPAYILRVLLQELEKPSDERLEWVFWFDADIVLMNPQIPLEIFVPPEDKWSHIHVLVTQDHRGLNNGVFMLRVHEASAWLMSATLSTLTAFPSLKLKFGDQSALEYWLQSESFRNSTMHVPQRWFNAYAGYRGRKEYADPRQPQRKFRPNSINEGDLLVHHAGSPKERPSRMTPWLEIAEEHLPEWEKPLADTTYPAEIEKFWSTDAYDEWKKVNEWKLKCDYPYFT